MKSGPARRPRGKSLSECRAVQVAAGICRNVDLCKWAVWRAKPRAKRRERHPLLGMGAKCAICGPFPCQKRPKRHPSPTMGAKCAI